ncbi:hypothetical protein FRC09_002228 [Ceratobasidium sp. 395]|nr:hypothetical protein FRC09_002228 [Ceratobasidium sp. 395]
MATQGHSIWGPEISQYSRNFNPRMSSLPEGKTERLYKACKVPSLARIENLLCEADLSPAEEADFPNLGTVTAIMQRYRVVNKSKPLLGWSLASDNLLEKQIFKNYYGFLCVRHLIHITYLAILQTSTLGGILDPPSSSLPWPQYSGQLAVEAMERAGRATTDTSTVQWLYMVIWGSVRFSGDPDVTMLARALWEDRDSFLTLCIRGLLPGCALLLFACFQLLHGDKDEDDSCQETFYLQDLAFRLYLVGSTRDREVAQLVCREAVERDSDWTNGILRHCGPEDTRTILKAYSEMLFEWREERSTPKTVDIDLLGGLASYVINLVGTSPVLSVEETVQAARVAIHSRCLYTEDARYGFARMLADLDILALAGRVLLLVSDEGAVPLIFSFRSHVDLPSIGHEFEDVVRLEVLLEHLTGLKPALEEAVAIAPELLLHESSIEFIKVMGQLGWALEVGLANFNEDETKRSPITGRVMDMMLAWTEYANALDEVHDSEAQACAYPRCHETGTREASLKIRYTCGRCNTVAYCDLNCQRA